MDIGEIKNAVTLRNSLEGLTRDMGKVKKYNINSVNFSDSRNGNAVNVYSSYEHADDVIDAACSKVLKTLVIAEFESRISEVKAKLAKLGVTIDDRPEI